MMFWIGILVGAIGMYGTLAIMAWFVRAHDSRSLDNGV